MKKFFQRGVDFFADLLTIIIQQNLEVSKYMDKEFSKGFLHDMGELLEMCVENETDNVILTFMINDIELKTDITFSIAHKNDLKN